MRHLLRAGALACVAGGLVTGLAACAGSPSPVAPPTELRAIEDAVPVESLWSRRFGVGTGDNYLHLHPLITDRLGIVADVRGRVWAFEPDTGRIQWEVDLERPLSTAPALVSGTLLFGTPKGEVLALDPENGAPRWQARVSSEVLAPAAGEDGVAVVRSVDGSLYGLDVQTGRRLWVYDREVPVLTLRGTSSLLVVDGGVLAGLDSGRLVALTLREGSVMWETPVAVPRGSTELERLVDLDGSMAIVDDAAYVVTYQGRVASVELASGRVLWSREMSSYAGLDADHARVYVSDASGAVWALDRRSGATLWRQEALMHRWLTAPTRIGNRLAVADLEGYVHWLSTEDGALKARARLREEPVIARMPAHGSRLYAMDRNGYLEVLQLREVAEP